MRANASAMAARYGANRPDSSSMRATLSTMRIRLSPAFTVVRRPLTDDSPAGRRR